MIRRFTTVRDRILLLVVVPVAFVLGLWVGVWSVPPEAFDAAMQTTNPAPGGGESTRLHYRPVPTWTPFMSGMVVVAGALLAWREWRMDSRWRDEREAER